MRTNCNPDCNPLAWDVPLPPGPVMAQEADGMMQWPLPALGATAGLAGHFDVTAAGACRHLAFTDFNLFES